MLDDPLIESECAMLPADVTLTPVSTSDIPVLRELAGTIWRQHYAGLVPAAQIDYMLADRFSDESLHRQIRATDRWLELLRIAHAPVGYCAHELAGVDAEGRASPAMKLGQLYVLQSRRGMGLGGFMLGQIERHARELGRRRLWLQVNKRNTGAIGFYKSAGFEVFREAVIEIGGGFSMDDYLMQKQV